MPRRIHFLVALLVAVAGVPKLSEAEELRIGLPADVKFIVRVDLPAVQSSTVGGRLFATMKEQIFAKLAAKSEGKGLSQEKLIEVLGFDPFEEVQAVVVAAAEYEAPEKSLVGVIQLRKTTGNLEGLLLTLPGYSVEDHGDHQIYSATPDDSKTLFCAFHTDGAGNRSVLLAAQRDSIVLMLDSLDGKGKSSASEKSVTLGGRDSPMVVVDLFELPPEMINQEGPPANVAKIVRSLSMQVSESGGAVNFAASLIANAEKQAEQLEQMVKGLHAMVGLAASSKGDAKLQMIEKYLTDLAVTRNGTTVDVSLSLPEAEAQKLIEEHLAKD